MRLIGLILVLGAISWTLYQMAGGGEAETIIPVEQQRTLDAAKALEQTMKEESEKSMQKAEGE